MDYSIKKRLLSSVLEDIEICPYFQPIICLKTGKIFAYEALIRGWVVDTKEPISPSELFALSDSLQLTQDFDQLCQQLALENFKEFDNNNDALLFMNIHTNCIYKESVDDGVLPDLTERMGFHPSVIGLEFIESKANSSHELIYFVRQQRESGFLIVVDDFGSEHSNIERLILIHPDIIKIDRNIIHGIDKDAYRQSILKSIVSLSEMTGSVCLAEGVETEAELLTCALLGVNLLQGFAIGRPDADLKKIEKSALKKIKSCQNHLRKQIVSRLKETSYLTSDVNSVADWLVRQIDCQPIESMETIFEEFIIVNSEIESIFVLDEDGIQVTDMVVAPHIKAKPHSYIFRVAEKGCDHSLRPYFTCFKAFKINRFFADKHLSSASGNMCRTLAVRLQEGKKAFILCIDFLEETIKTPLLSE
ncbi:MAG: EAL domain-containing protein [Spirochaetaceae bacterium]|nr:EAL domain-containing protein [Spirochaetaceae bacterium]MBR2462823.1 EAL domain-containing protein [Spirochaetaceae bacterium]